MAAVAPGETEAVGGLQLPPQIEIVDATVVFNNFLTATVMEMDQTT